MPMSCLGLKQLRRIIRTYCDPDSAAVLREVLLACKKKRLLLARYQDFVLTEHRAALEPLIGDRNILPLSAETIAQEENDDFFQRYHDPVDSLICNNKFNSIMGKSNALFHAVADSIERKYGSGILLRMNDNDSSTVPTVVAHMVVSAIDQLLEQVMEGNPFFINPLAALQTIVRFPPIAISDTEIIVLTK